jgi:uncharacterized LabA/DUF88 family protein
VQCADAGLVTEMSKKPKMKPGSGVSRATFRVGRAQAHQPLIDNRVHVFVDDQNLFYQIVNHEIGKSFRVDFGRLLLEVCKDTNGLTRSVASAYIAGVIPDDDTFWNIAESAGFKVRRGFLGTGNRSKQDDAYLITDLVSTLYEFPGPSTAVVVAGDADYMPPLMKANEKGWRTEVAFLNRGISSSLEAYVHEFRTLTAQSFQYFKP